MLRDRARTESITEGIREINRQFMGANIVTSSKETSSENIAETSAFLNMHKRQRIILYVRTIISYGLDLDGWPFEIITCHSYVYTALINRSLAHICHYSWPYIHPSKLIFCHFNHEEENRNYYDSTIRRISTVNQNIVYHISMYPQLWSLCLYRERCHNFPLE